MKRLIENSGDSIAEASALIDALYEFYGRFADLDDVIAGIDWTAVSGQAIIAVFRVTYAARDKLPSYAPALARANFAFVQRGEHHDRLLQGLPVPTMMKVWLS